MLQQARAGGNKPETTPSKWNTIKQVLFQERLYREKSSKAEMQTENYFYNFSFFKLIPLPKIL